MICFGNGNPIDTLGVTLTDFRKMMFAYHQIPEKKWIIDSVDNIISKDLEHERGNRNFLDKEIKKWAITNTIPHNV